MTWLTRLVSALKNLARRRAVESDLNEETRAFVALLEEEKLRAGLPPERARREALIEAGGVAQVQEAVRDARAGAWLASVGQDVRYGARSLARTPGFSLAAMLALALGIGASAAIFSVVEAVLLRPLAYREPDRLVVLLHNAQIPVSPGNFLDWRRQASSFERLGAVSAWQPNLTGDHPERLNALRVSSEIPQMLGVAPVLGRPFTPANDSAGYQFEVILSYGLWQRQFAGDSGVVGRELILDGQSYAVVGVMPDGFAFPPFWFTGAQLWAPLPLTGMEQNRGDMYLRVFGRLKPGVTLAAARAEVANVTAQLEAAFPGTNRDVTVTPLTEMVVGRVRPAIRVLLGAVLCVLLIACANVAHMLLARGAAREREMAVRLALGAGRSRVTRQLITESLLLAGAGGLAGLLLAAAGTRALVRLSAGSIPRADGIAVNGVVLVVTLAVTVLTGLAFGLAPALQVSAGNLFGALRDGARHTASSGRRRVRSVLIVSEFALALMLLAGAGLLLRSFMALRAVDPGWDPSQVVSMTVSITGSPEAEVGRRAAFFTGLLERVRALPGVAAASAINHLPLAGDLWGWRFNVEGQPTAPQDAPRAAYRVVLPGYFNVMRLPLVKGRDFELHDDLAAPLVVVVNEHMAAKRWPGEDPIGKRVTFDVGSSEPAWVTVVGVARDAAAHDWAAPPGEEFYRPYTQSVQYLEQPGPWVGYLTLVVRAGGDPMAVVPSVRQAVWDIDRNLPISDIAVMDDVVTTATARPRFYMVLLVAFAVVALSLAAVGIYGVMSYQVNQRSAELGIRMALGARQSEVLGLVVREGMVLALGGAGIGLVGALALSRVMQSLLFGVGATDLVTFAGVAVLLVVVAFTASVIPAWRASRIDPQTALRCE